MGEISFFEEDIQADLPPSDLLIQWLSQLAEKYKSDIIQLNYIFCSDEYLLQINIDHLQHDYYTDIITFPYQEGEMIESDVFISVDRIKENAKQYDVSYLTELLRVMAHGLLHLVGLDDKTASDQQSMRSAEQEAIIIFNNMKRK